MCAPAFVWRVALSSLSCMVLVIAHCCLFWNYRWKRYNHLISMESNNGGLRSLISGRASWETMAVAMVNICKASHDGNVSYYRTRHSVPWRGSRLHLILISQSDLSGVLCSFLAKLCPDFAMNEQIFRLLIAPIAGPPCLYATYVAKDFSLFSTCLILIMSWGLRIESSASWTIIQRAVFNV